MVKNKFKGKSYISKEFILSDSSDDEKKEEKSEIWRQNMSGIFQRSLEKDKEEVVKRRRPERRIKAVELMTKNLEITSDIFTDINEKNKGTKFFKGIPTLPACSVTNVSDSEEDVSAPPKKKKASKIVIQNEDEKVNDEMKLKLLKQCSKIENKKLKYLPDDGGIMRKGYPFYHWVRTDLDDNYKYRLKQHNITLRYGQFTEEEDERMIKNWKSYCKKFGTKEEELFWYIGGCSNDGRGRDFRKEENEYIERTALFPRLCKGLDDRMGYSVVRRLLILYSPITFISDNKYIRNLTKEDKENIINMLKKYNYNCKRVAFEVGQTWLVVANVLRIHRMETDYPYFAMGYIYNEVEKVSLKSMEEIMTSDEDVEDLKATFVSLAQKIPNSTSDSISIVFKTLKEYIAEDMKKSGDFKKTILNVLPWRHCKPTTKEAYIEFLNLRLNNIENGEGSTPKDEIFYEIMKEKRFYLNSPDYPKIGFTKAHKKYKTVFKIYGKDKKIFNSGKIYNNLRIEKYIIENLIEDGGSITKLKANGQLFTEALENALLMYSE
uniref:SET domain-containing protein n=1 Tax=Parastrongyloides trichosuri TaxID=131310 RepID=A0A0N4ZUE4_PARTI